jgi:hypothetical protein
MTTPQTKSIWVVWHTDMSGFSTTPIGYCNSRVEAEAYAFNRFESRGPYSKPQPVTGELAVLIDDNWYSTSPRSYSLGEEPNRYLWPIGQQLELSPDEVDKCAAMKKLTPEERKLLKLI